MLAGVPASEPLHLVMVEGGEVRVRAIRTEETQIGVSCCALPKRRKNRLFIYPSIHLVDRDGVVLFVSIR